MNRRIAFTVAVAALVAATALAQEKKPDRETKVKGDKARVEAAGKWIYDDLPRATAEAKKSGKPLLVVFRCIPCEACAKLDEDVVDCDPVVAMLLDQFVCVRIPHANGMDLSIFQFDYDESWAAFMMNADMTIYGRYGTRSDRTHSENDVSLEGFAKALEAGLAVHAGYPGNRESLKWTQGRPSDVKAPEDFPTLKTRYAPSIDWQGKVVPSCMHCHMVLEAQRRALRDAGKPIPGRLLFPYPNPKTLGLVMDPQSRTAVKSVVDNSPAARGGFLAGDEIVKFGVENVNSTADMQHVLDRVIDDAGKNAMRISVDVVRGGQPQTVTLDFVDGWRSGGDISWRASSWDLRRMTTGGMLLEALPAEERAQREIKDGAMALLTKHVGQYGEHAAAKNAGFQQGDVVVAVNGRSDVMTETEWMTWLVNAKKPGDKVAVTVLRGDKKLELTLPMQ